MSSVNWQLYYEIIVYEIPCNFFSYGNLLKCLSLCYEILWLIYQKIGRIYQNFIAPKLRVMALGSTVFNYFSSFFFNPWLFLAGKLSVWTRQENSMAALLVNFYSYWTQPPPKKIYWKIFFLSAVELNFGIWSYALTSITSLSKHI